MDICEIYNPYPNQTVTKYYLSIIESSLNGLGVETKHIEKMTLKFTQTRGIVVVLAKDVLIAKLLGYAPIIYWKQGIDPEESYLRNKSNVRKGILEFFDRVAIRWSNAIFMVSESMVSHVREKYGYNKNNYYVMPCFNCEIKKESFSMPGKYQSNCFVYAGGLQAWQCFKDTLKCYKYVEDLIPDCLLKIFTKDVDEAEEIVKQFQIKNYEVSFLPPEQIDDELKKAKFGFSLRDNILVNNVATPTKLSSYIGNGVIPIYSSSLFSFHSIAKDSNYTVCVEPKSFIGIDKLISLCEQNINPEDVEHEFSTKFGNYYSSSFHIKKIIEFFKKFSVFTD